MLAISWNIRGLGKAEKKRAVRCLVEKHKPIMLFLQETKLSSFDNRLVRILRGSVLNRGMGVEAEGASGGLLSLWNEDLFEVKLCILNRRCIILGGVLMAIKKEVVFCNVYGACIENERKDMWNFIISSTIAVPIPWVLGGDFNSVLEPSERIGEGNHTGSMRSFKSFIHEIKVLDIPLSGMSFTWTNFRVHAAWARLDRFLLSPEILNRFPNLVKKGFYRSVSDHNAIGISEPKVDWGPSPFRFFNWWMENKELMLEAIGGWKGCKVGGSKSRILKAKMKATKLSIKKWLLLNKTQVSTTEQLEDSLVKLDNKAELEGWTDSLRESRRRRNLISDISFDGVVVTDPILIRQGVFDFFKKHYENVSWLHQKIEDLSLKRLTEGERINLEQPFSLDEVWEAVESCDGNKAHGPDGLNLNFVKKNWEVIKVDYMNFIETDP
ncbi:hypothetical protein Dsin_032613 [Dipteronia sinensis]|uniref:Endonuclease/exonuclease/phosphatase domain-containing protein n=1 Tax=Dipteronia sinensis TaxID=43782 RepID=A0AAE0DMP0_9ROSI|nr:hypothetical protein Dsin_032613 [Dipteronia sinensis]